MDEYAAEVEQNPARRASLYVLGRNAELVHLVFEVVGEALDVGVRGTGRSNEVVGDYRQLVGLYRRDVQRLFLVEYFNYFVCQFSGGLFSELLSVISSL